MRAMESTKEQFNFLARMFMRTFTDDEKEIYLELVINRYSPQDFKEICDYIKADPNQKRFPTPIEFERVFNTICSSTKVVEEYKYEISQEQKEEFFRFLREECLKPIIENFSKGK